MESIESKIPVKVFKIKLMCDKCNVELIEDNIDDITDRPSYKYKCPECGESTIKYEAYPKYIYEDE